MGLNLWLNAVSELHQCRKWARAWKTVANHYRRLFLHMEEEDAYGNWQIAEKEIDKLLEVLFSIRNISDESITREMADRAIKDVRKRE